MGNRLDGRNPGTRAPVNNRRDEEDVGILDQPPRTRTTSQEPSRRSSILSQRARSESQQPLTTTEGDRRDYNALPPRRRSVRFEPNVSFNDDVVERTFEAADSDNEPVEDAEEPGPSDRRRSLRSSAASSTPSVRSSSAEKRKHSPPDDAAVPQKRRARVQNDTGSSDPSSSAGPSTSSAPSTSAGPSTSSAASDVATAEEIKKTEEALLTRQVLLVVNKRLRKSERLNPRIKSIRKFDFIIAENCHEARRGNRYGEWQRDEEKSWPGIPNNKFSFAQMKTEFGESKTNQWALQNIFENEEDPSTYLLYYEGWSSVTSTAQPIDQVEITAPDMIEFLNIRKRFNEELKKIFEREGREFFEEKVPWKFPNQIFWLYQDFSYFHTMLHKEQGLAPIWYAGAKHSFRPPRFAYTPINIIQNGSFERCKGKEANKTFNEILQPLTGIFHCFRNIKNRDKWPCEKKEGCICDFRFTILYGESNGLNGHRFVKNVIPRVDGTIDPSSFSTSDARVLMECSDRCGCSCECPRRRLQQGQQKPLCIYHEREKGFGIRAAARFGAGEFICEYTGIMRHQIDEDEDEELDGHMHRKEMKQLARMNSNQPSTSSTSRRPVNPSPVKSPMKPKSVPTPEEQDIIDQLHREHDEQTGCRYEAVFQVIDTSMVINAENVGNVARFINHSCNPNATFMETYSRRYECDPLIPRISVYTIKEIEIGEEITVNYYCGKEPGNKKNGRKCLCNTTPCMEFLPSE